MKLDAETGYALDLLAGLDDATTIVRLPLLAAEVGVPVREGRRIMAKLGAAGLVTGRRGRTGGYRLARPLAEISLGDVLAAMRASAAAAGGTPSAMAQNAAAFLERATSVALAYPISAFVPLAAA